MSVPQPYPPPQNGPQRGGPLQGHLPEVRPARIWYWVGVLLFPLALCTTAVIVMAGGPSFPDAWILLTPGSVVVATIWIAAVYMLRDRSDRRRRSLLPPPPTLMYAAAYPGGPAYPMWFQPRAMPPLEPGNLRPRRLWYGIAALLTALSPPVSGISRHVVGEAVGVLLALAFLFGGLALCVVLMVKRAGHRKRIAQEHLAKEWEQAQRG